MHFAVIATLILASLIALLGVAILLRPAVFTGLAQYFVNPAGIWIAAGIRLFAAVVLWFAAPASHFPDLFRLFAVVALIAAVAVLLIGHRRIQRFINWTINRPPAVIRIYALLAMTIGGFVLWALLY